MTPRVLFVSRERFRLPLDDTQRRKWDAVGELLDYRIVAAAQPGSPTSAERFLLAGPTRPRALDGALYYLRLPWRVAQELRRFHPDVVIAQNVHETVIVLGARAAVRSRARVVLDLHGDWRAATRLYGSRLRALLNPVNDVVGPLAIRRADAVRVISAWTAGLVRAEGVEPRAIFPAFVDATAFRERPPAPLPARPRAVFVGVLEGVKGFDTLAAAWPRVAEALPEAELHVVGRGTLEPLARTLVNRGASWTESTDAAGVAAAIDDSWVLCLPSRAEGLGRVAIEAMCRGRGVVGGDAGGIPDLVEDDVTGLLVTPGDPEQLARAIVQVLGDRALAVRLGAAASRKGEEFAPTPAAYAAKVRALVDGLR
ncbi:MAG TPA: glycosyltransferase family 4 protein [Gaiellaceae bacterium]|nr:glycosyltransferase family 4 protein [Gaiellaceae bacterium]